MNGRQTMRASLIKLAQRLTNGDGRPRWVKYTSLGWRCELYPPPPDPDDRLTIPITPQRKPAVNEPISTTMNVTIREGMVTQGDDGPLDPEAYSWGWIATDAANKGAKGHGDDPNDAYQRLLIQLAEYGLRSPELRLRLEQSFGDKEIVDALWSEWLELDKLAADERAS